MFVIFAAFWFSSFLLTDGTPLHCANVDNVNYQRRYFYGIIWMWLQAGRDNSDFWSIVDDRHSPKTEIQSQLIAYGNRMGGNLKIAANGAKPIMESQHQAFRGAITNSALSEATKNFALTEIENFYNFGLSWEQTCQRNNRAIMQQSQETVDEMQANPMSFNIQVFINSYCLTEEEAERYRIKYSDCPGRKRPAASGNDVQEDDGDEHVIQRPRVIVKRPQVSVEEIGNLELLLKSLLSKLAAPKQQQILLLFRNPKLNLRQIKSKLRVLLGEDGGDEDFYQQLLVQLSQVAKKQREQIQQLKVSLDAKRFLDEKLRIDFDEDATVQEKCQRKTKLITKYGNKVVKELNFVSDCSEGAGFTEELDSGHDEVRVIKVVRNYKIDVSSDD